MKTSKNSARASLVKRPFVSDFFKQSPLIKNKFTFQENNKKSDKSKDILREKFKEQRMIFVENQEKCDRKINKSVEPTDSDSDINIFTPNPLSDKLKPLCECEVPTWSLQTEFDNTPKIRECDIRRIKKCSPNNFNCKWLTPSEQKEILFDSSNSFIESEFQYAISAKWWRTWCDFVNIEFKPLKDYMTK